MRLVALLLPALVSFGVLFPGTAHADVRDDLDSLRDIVAAMAVDPLLEKKESRAAAKIEKKADKALSTPEEDLAKLLGRAAKVVQLVEKGEKKGLDLGLVRAELVTSIRVEALLEKARASVIGAGLAVDKDREKVDRKLLAGDRKIEKGDEQAKFSRRAKLFARAAKVFGKAAGKAEKLLQKEIKKGLLVFRILGSSLTENPVITGLEPIGIETNGVVAPPPPDGTAIQILNRPARTPTGIVILFEPLVLPDEPNTFFLFAPDGIPAGDYTLVLRGADVPAGEERLVSISGLPLDKTYEFDFTVEALPD